MFNASAETIGWVIAVGVAVAFVVIVIAVAYWLRR
jgi:hypothetical protein